MIEDVLLAGQKGGSVSGQLDAHASAIAIIGRIRGIIMQSLIDRDIDLDTAFEALLQGIDRETLTPTHRLAS